MAKGKSMETLEKLFSSGTLVRIMRIFLFNPEEPYDNDDLKQKTGSTKKAVDYETKLLHNIGFLKKRTFYKTVEVKSKSKKKKEAKSKKKKVKGWVLDPKFPYLTPLHTLLISTNLISKGDILRKLQGVGAVKLILISGVFIREPDSRVDLLVVGDKLKKQSLARAVRGIENMIGTELYYSALPSEDFEYRVSVRDRLIRDIFEHAHEVILNRLKRVELPEGKGVQLSD